MFYIWKTLLKLLFKSNTVKIFGHFKVLSLPPCNLKLYYTYNVSIVVCQSHRCFQSSEMSGEGFREWGLKIVMGWFSKAMSDSLVVVVGFTPVNFYQQNSRILFSYFTTLIISMTMLYVQYTQFLWPIIMCSYVINLVSN
jgi:hypothetical protein